MDGSGITFLVPFFTTIGVAAPLKNDPILSGRSTGSFRHLELQNPSIISDFRHRDRMVQEEVRSSRRNGKHFYRIGYITQVTTTYYITTYYNRLHG